MKNKFGKLYGFVLALSFFAGLFVVSVPASAAGSYTLAVGDETTLYSNIPSRYAVTTVNWTSNNYQAVEITQHTNSYCKIRVNQYFSSPVIISCNYYYIDSFGGASYMRQGYTDFTIYISKSGGTGSTGSMTVSPSSVSLDLADGKPKVVTLKYDKGTAKTWNFGFLSENGCVELWEVWATGPIGTDEAEVYAKKPGTDTVTCILYADGQEIASAKLNVNVICSHKYDEGVVRVQPGPGKEGSMVYTCQVEGCGDQYEVSIPALPEEKKEDSEKEENNKEESSKEENSSKGNDKEKNSKENTNTSKKSETNKKNQSDKVTEKNIVKLSKESATIYPGQKLSLNIKNAKSGKKTWSSNKPKVASVDANGKVTAKKPGTAIISVKTGGKTLTCRVTVRKVFTASSSNISVSKGKKKTVTVTCSKKLKLKYVIKNKKIVSCAWKKMKGNNYKLIIRGKKKGKTSITLTNSFNQEKIKLTVKVR